MNNLKQKRPSFLGGFFVDYRKRKWLKSKKPSVSLESFSLVENIGFFQSNNTQLL